MTSRINRSRFYGRAWKLYSCIKSITLQDMINEVKLQEIVSRAGV